MRRTMLAAALLLGAMPAFAQSSGDPPTDAAARTLEQNRRVVLTVPQAAPTRPAEARARTPEPRSLRLTVEGRVASAR
ncbi:hypothetical protein JYK14_15495 [Siccirubricoccus sp. KC 17139]|uniref:Uncharacterized protein n=1 Tax=Siccirubricoccus soli TaxID=2899147 RepID=A0ABT1D8P8_9PROT|nr:hypothetical protein [Siccirubricoccus soli]MCO6417554.1 hypothetical protein [Siccirubricoccus soli]MCP2683689.1 hypothetical protein [Siccirubricoccus soli]